MDKLMQLHPDDNILVIRKNILSGDTTIINDTVVEFPADIELGHKVAAGRINKNELIIKYGVPIGSAISDIKTGDHIHLHNMKSDYIATFLLDNQFKNE